MSWYDPFKPKRRKWSERSPTGKKIYVIYYLILVSVLGVILWIGEFSEEAQTRDQQKMLEWQESRKKEALEKYGAEGSGKNLPFSSLSEDLKKKDKKNK